MSTQVVRQTGAVGGWKRDTRAAAQMPTLGELRWHPPLGVDKRARAERLWRTGAVYDEAATRPDLALAAATSAAGKALGVGLGLEVVQQMFDQAEVGTSIWRVPAAVRLAGARLTSADDLIDAVATDGPVLLGLPWREGLDQADSYGTVRYHGSVLGPHVVLVVGVSATAVRLLNSWGTGWASLGRAWLPRPDLVAIFAAKPEALVLTKAELA